MKRIKLSQGQYALVDNEDYDILMELSPWYTSYNSYTKSFRAERNVYTVDGRRIRIKMSRFLTNFPDNMEIDHKNHNTLDNRKTNLRIVTKSKNHMNEKKARTYKGKITSSIYKGVSFNKQTKKWHCAITLNGHLIYLGYFTHEKNAAIAYNTAAKKYFGNYAHLNKINTDN